MKQKTMFSKLAICQWCLPKKGPDALRQAAELGYDGVEMDLGWRDPKTDLRSDAVLEKYLKAKAEAGILTPSLAVNSIHMNRAEDLPETRRMLDSAIRVAVKLEAKVLQLPSFFGEGMRDEAEFTATTEALRYACRQAAPHGIVVASENQLDAAQTHRLVKEVGEENFGIYYDTANPYWFDDRDGLALMDESWPYICEIHVKDHELHGGRRNVSLGRGGCQLPEALAMIRERDYQGWLVVENEQDEALLMQDAAYVRAHMA